MTFTVSEKIESICASFFVATGNEHFLHEKRKKKRDLEQASSGCHGYFRWWLHSSVDWILTSRYSWK